MENPGDTCRRLADQLARWLNWIDDHTDLQTAWQLYADILENRRDNPAAPHKPLLNAENSTAEKTQVLCSIEGMYEISEDITLSDFLLVRLFLGAIALLVVFESLTTIWR